MYAAATGALAGEILGKHKVDLLVATVILPAAALAVQTYFGIHGHADPVLGNPLSVMMVGSLSLLLCTFFAYVDMTVGARNAGFPPHILVLPLPTWLLALVPIVTGSLVICAFALLWLRFIAGANLDWPRQLAICGAIASMLCWMQAMSWRLIRRRPVRLLTLAVILTFAALALVSSLTDDPHFLFGRTAGSMILLATTATGYGLAYVAVIRSRHGKAARNGPYAQRPMHVRASPFAFRMTRLPRLSDGVAAQQWFEWRLFGWALPAPLIVFGMLVVVMLAVDRIGIVTSTNELSLMGLVFLMFAPLTGGLYAAKSLDAPRVELGSFRAVLPLTDFELGCSKLSLAIRSHALGLTIVVAVMTAVLLMSHNNKAATALWSNLQAAQGTAGAIFCVLLSILGAVTITWAAAVYAMSALLFSAAVNWRKDGWKVAAIGVPALAVLVKLAAVAYRARDHVLPWLASAHGAVVLPAAATLALGLALLPRFRVLNRLSDLGWAAGVCGAALAACAVLLWQLDLSMGLRWALTWLAVTVALLAFIPFLLVPVVIGLLRHR